LVAGIVLLAAVALIPQSSHDALNRYMYTLVPEAKGSFIAVYVLLTLRNLLVCTGRGIKVDGISTLSPDGFKSVYLKCYKNMVTQDMADVFGWDGTLGVMPVGTRGGTGYWGPCFYSHSSYKKAVENPAAGRPNGMFILSNRSTLPPGVIPVSVDQILLEFDTGHPEWKRRRQLLWDGLPALHQQDSVPAAIAPPGVSPRDGHSDQAIMRVLGVTLFQWLFGVDVSNEIELILEYDKLFAPAVFGGFTGGVVGGKRLAEIRDIIEHKVARGEVGREFLALAESRGMPGQTRLQDAIWVVLFAGFGGTSNLAIQTIKHILANPGLNVPLLRKDVEAFMLEAARLYPPVGGMNPIELREPLELKLPAGKTVVAPVGTWGLTITSGANRDPTIFEDPETFRPGRKNAERLLTWNAELGDIRAGKAVRGCPGTHLSLRLATSVVSYFVDGAESAARGKAMLNDGEL